MLQLTFGRRPPKNSPERVRRKKKNVGCPPTKLITTRIIVLLRATHHNPISIHPCRHVLTYLSISAPSLSLLTIFLTIPIHIRTSITEMAHRHAHTHTPGHAGCFGYHCSWESLLYLLYKLEENIIRVAWQCRTRK